MRVVQFIGRSIDVVENGRKFLSICVEFALENRRIAVFGARTIFLGFALIFLWNQKLFFQRCLDRCRCLDRSRRSKTVEKNIAFAIVSSEEIDAPRFSGTEQFLYCAPLISPLFSTIAFFRNVLPIRSDSGSEPARGAGSHHLEKLENHTFSTESTRKVLAPLNWKAENPTPFSL